MKKVFYLFSVFIFSTYYQKSFSQSVEAGEYYTILLCSSGTPKGTGNNGSGQLGIGITWNENLPVANNLTDVIAISGGESHTLILKSNGTVWAYGANWIGQLGNGTNDDADTAVQVNNLTGVTAIAAGRYFSLALKSNGTVWAWGANWNGALGDGTGNNSNVPVQVSGISGVTAISAGYSHALAVKSNGTAWAWGSNGSGQLGDGTNNDRYTPVQVMGISGITSVAGGSEHSLALKSNGSVWAWGANWDGQLGDGTNNATNLAVQVSGFTSATHIAAGAYHSLAIKSNGTAWAWGSNGSGQLGNGTTNYSNLPLQINSLSNIISISGGYEHSVALRNDGTFWAWGSNWIGQLGNGTYDDTYSPVQMHDCCSNTPEISLSDTCIIDTIETGRSSTTSFIIRNFRCSTLNVTNITSSNAAFTVSPTSVSVPGYDSVMITVTYTPTILGNNLGTLTIFNSAGDTTMCIAGYCLQAPEITKNPSSFNVTLGCNAASTSTLTIGNTGLGTLDFDITIEPPTTTAIFYDGFESGGIASWNSGVDTYTNTVTTNSPASGTYCLQMTPTNLSGNYLQGLNHVFQDAPSNYISFKIKTPNIPIWNYSSVLIGNSSDIASNGPLAYFDISNDGGNRIIELGASFDYFSYPLNENQWYKIEYRNIDYTNKTFDFYIDGILIGSSIYFLNPDISTVDVIHLFSDGYFTTLYDDIIIVENDPNLWLSTSPSGGTAAPSGSTNLNVNFNSANLPEGVYYGNVTAYSNDPVTPQLLVPCTLTVTGDPDIDMSVAACTNYNTIMVGATHQQDFQVDNVGCDTLRISNVTSSSGQFIVNSFPAVVPPFASGIIMVTFQPTLVAAHTATISVINNDTDTTFCVQGTAVPAPTLSVTPASFNMTAACSQSVTSTLTISNPGAANLIYNILGFNTVPIPTCTVATTAWCCGRGITNVALNTINNPSADGSVGYQNFTSINTVLEPNKTYTLSAQTGPSNYEYVNAWIDWNNNSVFESSENIMSNHYALGIHTVSFIVPAGAVQNSALRMRIVSSTSWNPQACTSMNYVQHEDYTVFVNNWLTIAPPLSSTILPSGYINLPVAFNSTGLAIGTYTYAIAINSNDPLNPTTQVPCTFTVTGSPDIDIPITGCPSFNTTMVGGIDKDTFTISNTGCDTLRITNVTTSSGQFVINSYPAKISPFSTGKLIVWFQPTAPATYSTTITISSNIPDEVFCLQGTCIPAATITVTPAFFDVTINSCDDVATSILTIGNTGSSALNFTLPFRSTPVPTCTVTTTGTCCNYGTLNVRFNTINNSSGNALAGYQDFTSISTSVLRNKIYQLNVQTGESQYVNAWIDWNSNGIFEGGEKVMNNIYALGTHTVNVTVPANAVKHSALRMRIVSDNDPNSQACSNVDYGQHEDYTVFVDNWLSASPLTGTIMPSSSNTVAVTFNSNWVTAGTYTSTLSVVSNDPLNPQVNIPCTLTVTGSPEIAFSAPCLNFGLQIPGSTIKDSVLLTNTGCDTLKISNILVSPGVYTVTPTSGNILPDQSAYIKVTFAPIAAASYTGTATIQSNIPDATFCLTGTGISILPLSVPLAAGVNHSLAICSLCNDGFAWGYNGYGQLGDGTTTDRHTRTLIKLAGITAIAGGDYHSIGLKSDGSVWAWGYNGNGQLGDGTYNQHLSPFPVSGLSGTSIAIAAGRYYSLALKGNGTVWGWGLNGNGQLGDGTTSQRLTPVQVGNLTGVTAIAAGMRHSLALKSDSTVWAWGYNGNGQLGDSSTTQSTTPVKVKNGLTGIIAIAAGRDHSLALKNDGTVWAWGYNLYGQLGDSSTTQRTTPVKVKNGLTGIIAIAAGRDHSLALKSDGTVWAWGRNGNGQLGNGNTGTNRTAPIQVSGLTTATAIAAGDYHSLAMKSDETVWAWGDNDNGNLGDGTTTDRNVPVQTKYLCPPKQVDIDIPLSGSCINYDTLILGSNGSKIFKVYNKGCDTLRISSITSTSTEFTVLPFPATIAPVDSGMITISLTPTITGTVTTTITVIDNDPDPDTSFCLQGVVIAAPVMSIVPASLSYTLACCDSVTVPLEISNTTGGSDLKWSLNKDNNNTLNFNGSNSYVQMNNSNVFDVNQLTIESWVYSDNYNQNGFIFEKGPVNTQYSLFFEGGWLRFRTMPWSCTNSDFGLYFSSIGITNGSWHHIAATFDGSNKKIYVDGVLKGTATYTCPLETGQAGEIIGAYNANGGPGNHWYYYNGNISEVRIWNYARSPQQIADNMRNRIHPGESGLVAYYPLSEGSGTIIYDQTVNSNNGASTSTSWTNNIDNPFSFPQGFSAAPAWGTVGIGGGDKDTVDITFNSCGLTIGTYTTQIIINSNDPFKTKDTIPLTLNVMGAAEANFSLFDSTGNCLELDSIMAFTSSMDTIEIFNSGCDTLFINSLQFSNSEFDSVYAPNYILLGNTDIVVVRFAPSYSVAATTTVTGTVTVHTNDNTVDSVICLHGEIFPRPIQMHAPNNFNITLGCNSTIVDTLLIHNTGGSDLMFGIMGGKLTRKIVLVAADDNSHITDVQTKLMATGKFSAVDIFDASFSTPTLSYLQNYDAVLVWSWWNSFSDPNLLGDNLADYSDGGGAVVTAMWTGNLGGYQILGRFNSDYYWCIAPNWTTSGTQTLGTIYNPTHPILDGVTSFNGGNDSYRPSTNSIYPGADRIANWSSGEPLVVTRTINGSNRVDLGMWPVSNDAYSGGWLPSTDGARLIANALYWAAGGGVDWMTLSPRVDTVVSGGNDSSIVEVQFTSTNFTVGTYTTNIIINSNDPLNSSDTVAVTLNITGYPEANFALMDSIGNCLDLDSIMAYTESTDTIALFNTGCDTLFIESLEFSSSAFDSAYAPNYILPGDTNGIIVRFMPSFSVAVTTTVTGTVTVHTNDNTVDSVLCLQGKVFPQPVIFIDPVSFDTTLNCNETLQDTITIRNTGLGTLIYNIDTLDYSAVFDGNGDYIYNFSSTLPTGNVMTAEAWIYPFASPTSSYNGIISWGQYSCTNKMILAIQSTGRPSMTTGCYSFIPNFGPAAAINQWNHIACVLNGTSVTLYMNGIPVNGTLSGLPDVQSSPLYLGYNDYNGYYFNGKIDEARIWNTARTQSEILATMNKELSGNEPGLVSYWNFDSINANDLAGTNDGNLNNNTYFAPDQPNKFYSLNGNLNGTLAPGDSSQIAIEFTSTGFLAGNYLDSIMVTSNDPQNNLTAVHLDLTVDGIAQANYFLLDSTGNCLDLDSIMELTTSTDTVGITNTGCDTLFIYNFNFTDGAYSAIYSPPYILPGDTDGVIVQFAPPSTGTITCNMTVNTNVGSPVICLYGKSFAKPVQCHDPDSYNTHFTICQDSILDTLNICNTLGLGELNYNLWSPYGRSAQFEGINDNITRGAINLPAGSVMTVEAWIYPVSYPTATYNGIVSWGTRGGGCYGSMVLSIKNDGRPSMANWCNDFTTSPGPAATLNQWNHIACVMNGQSVTLYMNGVPSSTTLGVMPNVQSMNLSIGSTDYPTGRQFDGKIDEVRIYNKALTQAEILARMHNSLTGNESGLMGYWNFDDSTATDFSPNINDGTLQNGAFITVPNVEFNPAPTGTVTPGGTYSVQVVFKKEGLAPGTHNIPIYLNSNDPLNRIDTVMVSMIIDSIPPVAPVANDTNVCFGNPTPPLIATGNPGDTIKWYSDASLTTLIHTGNSFVSTQTAVATYTYYVTATDSISSCESLADTVFLFINGAPTEPTANDDSSCFNAAVPLLSSTGTIIQWWSNQAATNLLFTGNPYNTGQTIANTYTFFVTDSTGGCPKSPADTVILKINALPSPPAGRDTAICLGSAVPPLTATVTGTDSIRWYNSSMVFQTSGDTLITGQTTAGTYTYYVTSVDTVTECESVRDTVTLSINNTSQPTATNKSGCFGGTIPDLTATGTNIKWYDSTMTFAFAGSPFTTSLTAVHTYTYYVTQTLNGCESNPKMVTLTINPIPAIPTAPDKSSCFGSPTPALTATGTNIMWYSNPALTTQVGTGSPYNTGLTAAGNYTFYVTQTAAGCPSPSDTVYLNIYALPTTPVASDTFVCLGNPVPDLLATGITGSNTVDWYSSPTLTPVIFTGNPYGTGQTTAGTYTYYVTQTYSVTGCRSNADMVTLTINSAPVEPISNDITVCFGQPVPPFTVTGSINQWYNASPLTTPVFTGDPYNAGLTAVGSYTYFVTDSAAGCPESPPDTTVLIINPVPAAPVSTPQKDSICFGNPNPSFAAAGTNIEWWNNPGATALVFSGSPFTPTVTATGTYSYYVTQSALGCKSPSNTTILKINALPVVNFGADVTQCGGTVTLNAGNPGATYLWSDNSTAQTLVVSASGTYSVVVTNAANCTNSDVINITINPIPAVPVSNPQNATICFGQANPSFNAAGTNVQWWSNASATILISTGSIFTPTVTAAGTYTYYVTQTSTDCKSPANAVMFTINFTPTPVASNVSAVFGSPVPDLTSTGTNVQWYNSVSAPVFSGNPFATGQTAIGTYTYYATQTLNGCESAMDIAILTIYPGAPAASNQSGCFGQTVPDLTATGTNIQWWSNPGLTILDGTGSPFATGKTAVGTYTYYVTQTVNSVQSPATMVTLTINAIPSAPTSSSMNVCSGNAVPDLTAAGISIQWWTDPGLTVLAGSGSPFATGETAVNTYTYYVTQTVNGCKSTGTMVMLSINALPATPTASNDTAICYNTTNPNFIANGTNIKWYDVSGTVVGTGSPFLPAQTAPGVYTYYVTQTNTVTTCESLRDSVKLTINSSTPPVAPDVAVCAGNPVPPLVATGTNIEWYNSSMTPVFSGSSYNTGQTTVGTYTYYVTQTNTVTTCSSPKDTVFLIISTQPTIAPTIPDADACFGSTIPDLVATSGTIINWYSDAALANQVFSGNPFTTGLIIAGTYTFFATDSTSGCPEGPSVPVILTINPLPATLAVNDTASCFGNMVPDFIANGTIIQWYDTSLAVVFSGDTFTTGQTAIGTYTYYVTQSDTVTGCESAKDATHLTINALPTPPSALDTAVCSAATIPNLTATGGTNIQWYNSSMTFVFSGNSYATGQTAAGTYTYYVTEMDASTGCQSVRDTSMLTIMLSPPIPTANNVAICAGNPVPSLTCTGANINWYSDMNLTTLVHTGNSYNTGQTAVGVYTYYVTDSLPGCVSSSYDTVSLIINNLPTKPVATSTIICHGSTGVLTATGNNPQWYSDATLINMVGTGNSFNTGITAVGTYTYYATDFAAGCGNSPSDTALLTIHPTPLVTANAYTVSIVQGDSAMLTGYNASTYSWSPSTGLNLTTGQTVKAAPTTTTSYTVTGTNQYGCSDSVTILVIVDPLGVIDFGNGLQDINIYPNPAINHFMLEFNTTLKTPIDIYLFNMLGEKVRMMSSEGTNGVGLMKHKYEIDTRTLTEGIYNIEIVTSSGTVNRRVVLIR